MIKISRKYAAQIVIGVLGLLALAQAWVVAMYIDEQSQLRDIASTVLDRSLSPSEQVRGTLEYFRNLPVITNESYILSPAFRFLRPTALDVARNGGDCADRSRLLINLLRLHNIKASKWALYDQTLAPRHAVVEVVTEQGKMVVDPLYGLVFPTQDGRYFGIREMADDPSILRRRLHELVASNQEPGALLLEGYPVEDYIYSNARTINWDKSILMRGLYRVLYVLFGERVNSFERPAFVEQPALMLLIGSAAIDVVLLVILVVVWRRAGNAGRTG